MTEPQREDRQEQRGLVCSDCGCQHFYVLYTRRRDNGRVMRRRECRNCGRRITTWESTSF